MSGEEEKETLFPFIPRKTPVVDLVRQKMNIVRPEEEAVDSTVQTFGEDFVKGLATSLGVKPSTISYDMIAQWIMDWNSLLHSESLDQAGQSMGQMLGKILSRATPVRRTESVVNRIAKERAERSEGQDSGDISIVG